jgi:hypothetical protein
METLGTFLGGALGAFLSITVLPFIIGYDPFGSNYLAKGGVSAGAGLAALAVVEMTRGKKDAGASTIELAPEDASDGKHEPVDSTRADADAMDSHRADRALSDRDPADRDSK